MLPCVSFKEVSQTDGSYNSGAPGTLTKADTVNSFFFPRPGTEAQESEGGGPKAAHWVVLCLEASPVFLHFSLVLSFSLLQLNPSAGVFCTYEPHPLTAMFTEVSLQAVSGKWGKTNPTPSPTWNFKGWQTAMRPSDVHLQVSTVWQSGWYRGWGHGQKHQHLRSVTISRKNNKSLVSILWSYLSTLICWCHELCWRTS